MKLVSQSLDDGYGRDQGFWLPERSEDYGGPQATGSAQNERTLNGGKGSWAVGLGSLRACVNT